MSKSRLGAYTWNIPTLSSRPHSNPRAIPKHIVQIVMEVKGQLKRCSEVVWHYINGKLGIKISLSSVRRILRQHHYFDGARKSRVRKDNPRRPLVTAPGELIKTDTFIMSIHIRIDESISILS